MTMLATSRLPDTARYLMTDNPISINEHATLQDAAAFLARRGISAAPVINDAGRPIGVLSRTDIARLTSVVPETPRMLGDFVNEWTMKDPADCEHIPVRQVMTPQVLSVALDASLAEICQKMLGHRVHRLFVIDRHGILVGVISALDVLRRLSSRERWPAPDNSWRRT